MSNVVLNDEPRASVSSSEDSFTRDVRNHVELTIVVGQTGLTLAEVNELRPGAMICLDEFLADPVTIFSGSALVGRGELQLIEGQLGVRITELYRSPLNH